MTAPLKYSFFGSAARDALRNPKVRVLLLLSCMIIITATVFYHFQEGWGWIDALYFSVITIATVGYGDFAPQTPLGKLFTVGYLIFGIGVCVVATATFAEHLLQHIRSELIHTDGKRPTAPKHKSD